MATQQTGNIINDMIQQNLQPGLPQTGMGLGTNFGNILLGGGAGIFQGGLGNLMEIIQRQGRTDPRLFNRQLTGIQRGTEAQQEGFGQRVAQNNLTGSGVAQAIQEAIGSAGQGRVADARASEAALTEQRSRSDLDILQRLILGPATNFAALGTGQFNADRQRGDQQNASELAFLGSLFGGAGGLLSGIGSLGK